MSDGPDAARVVQLFAPVGGGGKGKKGSGYLVGSDLVLTAGHVVAAATSACEVRLLADEKAYTARLEWSGQGVSDAALLRIVDKGWQHRDLEPISFGRLVSDSRAACAAVGFPWAQSDQRDNHPVSRTERIQGKADPLAGIELTGRRDFLAIHVAGGVPKERPGGGSPWAGMSGAALFSGPLLVGVVIIDPDRFDPDRLVAVTVSALAEDRAFGRALSGADQPGLVLGAIEAVGVLSDPYLRGHGGGGAARGQVPSVSRLLDLRSAVVPFRGRERELAQLRDWCLSHLGLAIGLITGVGGTGKTRLAAELCLRQQHAGAVAGFLRSTLDAQRLAELVGGAPVLVVVDEANTRTSELCEVIPHLASRPAQVPVRLLLLARHDGEWRNRLVDDLRNADLDAADIVERPFMLPLGGVDDTPAARREAFGEAIQAFADALGKTLPPALEIDLSAEMFEAILFVHLAALAALDDDVSLPSMPILPDKLLEWALGREARYWHETAPDRGLDPETIQRAVALATMTTANSEEEAVRALGAIPDFAEARDVARRIARWLRSLYSPSTTQPGIRGSEDRRWFHPLAPDVLGHALIAHVLKDVPSLPTRLLECAADPQAHAALTALTNAAKAFPEVRNPLAEAIAKRLPRIWKTALAVAQQTGDPLGRILAEALEQTPRPAMATEIEAALPDHTIALRELAVVATQQALDCALEQPPSSDRDERAARLLNHQSNRLADLGQREEALAAIEKAVHIYQRLAAARPDAPLPELAGSRHTQSHRLAELGLRKEALTVIEEAVGIYRLLAAERPGVFQPRLAMSLNSQSMLLADLGQRKDALTVIEKAVGICRRLAVARPDAPLPELAAVLHTQSHRLADLGRRKDALTVIEEAVGIYQQLAEARPDAFQQDLAISLNSQSDRLADLGRREEALTVIEEAVGICRPLAAARPEAFQPILADVLHTESYRLAELGRRRKQSLTVIEKAVGIYRLLARKLPDAFQPKLASSLYSQSDRLADLGDLEDALTVIEEAVGIYQQLAAALPDAFQPGLAMSLNSQSGRLAELGLREEALTVIEEAVGIYRPLARKLPDAFQPGLAMSLNSQSMRLAELGRREDALTVIEEAVGIYRPLARKLPDAFQPKLADVLHTQSHRLAGLGRRKDALTVIEDAVGIYQQLAAALPDAFQPGFAMSLNSQSMRLADLGRREEALTVIEEAVGICRRLAEARPDAPLPELADVLHTQSYRLADLRRREEALTVIEDAVGIYRPLAAARPDAFQPKLADVLHTQSRRLAELGKREQALEAIWEAFRLVRRG
jgi:tetratricopeptide (TPR) repeat protein